MRPRTGRAAPGRRRSARAAGRSTPRLHGLRLGRERVHRSAACRDPSVEASLARPALEGRQELCREVDRRHLGVEHVGQDERRRAGPAPDVRDAQTRAPLESGERDREAGLRVPARPLPRAVPVQVDEERELFSRGHYPSFPSAAESSAAGSSAAESSTAEPSVAACRSRLSRILMTCSVSPP